MTEDTEFARPAFSDLLNRAQADIEARLPGADSRLRRSALSVMAHVTTGLTHGLYGALQYIARQSIIDRADTAHLDRWGASYGFARKAGSRATGSVTIMGEKDTVIPAGSLLERGDGAQFTTTASVTLVAGVPSASASATAPVMAKLAGELGNSEAGSPLALSAVSPSISATATVDTQGLTGGVDAESDEAYRARLLDRLRQPPHGGNANDYVQWALEVPGVTRAFVSPLEAGPGTVTIRFVMDDVYPDNGIPQPADVAAVQAYIDALDRRPVTAVAEVLAPTAKPLNVTIGNLMPNTLEVQNAITAELADLIRRERVPGGTIYLSTIWEAVAIATGERSHRILSPASDVTQGAGEIATFGNVTFV